jgi:hypothetical protein
MWFDKHLSDSEMQQRRCYSKGFFVLDLCCGSVVRLCFYDRKHQEVLAVPLADEFYAQIQPGPKGVNMARASCNVSAARKLNLEWFEWSLPVCGLDLLSLFHASAADNDLFSSSAMSASSWSMQNGHFLVTNTAGRMRVASCGADGNTVQEDTQSMLQHLLERMSPMMNKFVDVVLEEPKVAKAHDTRYALVPIVPSTYSAAQKHAMVATINNCSRLLCPKDRVVPACSYAPEASFVSVPAHVCVTMMYGSTEIALLERLENKFRVLECKSKFGCGVRDVEERLVDMLLKRLSEQDAELNLSVNVWDHSASCMCGVPKLRELRNKLLDCVRSARCAGFKESQTFTVAVPVFTEGCDEERSMTVELSTEDVSKVLHDVIYDSGLMESNWSGSYFQPAVKPAPNSPMRGLHVRTISQTALLNRTSSTIPSPSPSSRECGLTLSGACSTFPMISTVMQNLLLEHLPKNVYFTPIISSWYDVAGATALACARSFFHTTQPFVQPEFRPTLPFGLYIRNGPDSFAPLVNVGQDLPACVSIDLYPADEEVGIAIENNKWSTEINLFTSKDAKWYEALDGFTATIEYNHKSVHAGAVIELTVTVDDNCVVHTSWKARNAKIPKGMLLCNEMTIAEPAPNLQRTEGMRALLDALATYGMMLQRAETVIMNSFFSNSNDSCGSATAEQYRAWRERLVKAYANLADVVVPTVHVWINELQRTMPSVFPMSSSELDGMTSLMCDGNPLNQNSLPVTPRIIVPNSVD